MNHRNVRGIPTQVEWGTRGFYLKLLICQVIGLSATNLYPNQAITHGTTGCIIAYFIIYIFLGIPLFYMELVVSQFTSRDNIDVWKIRPCLSHIGYIVIIWQILILLYNHMMVSFIIHYLIITFENPIPYYLCGEWATEDCDIIPYNYTVHQHCVKSKEHFNFCKKLYKTFPEYQYQRYNLLKSNQSEFTITWRVSLASSLACIITFISCFKRQRSLKWVIWTLILYPKVGYMILMIGSMLQKGLVSKYREAFDGDFKMFLEKFRLSNVIQLVVHTISVGSGLSFNLAASTAFRSPCYANTVITVVAGAVFTILTACTTAMMTCPFAYEYENTFYNVMSGQLALIFEKIPILLKQYDNKTFYLVVMFSSNAVLGMRTMVIIFYNLLETVTNRSLTVAKYPGLFSFVGIITLFLINIPMMSYFGVYVLGKAFRRYMILTSCFIAIIECIVFILWYSLDKLSEDVHFMQGIKPNIFMKICWVLSVGVLGYSFFKELYYKYNTMVGSTSDIIGLSVLLFFFSGIIGTLLVRLLVAACKKTFWKAIQLDSSWGPKSELLRRSRAMFTAQAMTKEYMYRQYHLQAGILARQRRSNVRVSIAEKRTTSSY